MGGCSKATQDIPPYMMADGNPAGVHGVNTVGLQRRGVGEEARQHLKTLYRILYRENLNTRQAVDKIRQTLPLIPEIQHVLEFVETSERGITR